VSAAASAHFANPRNDFWRLLHDAGFTPRLFDPQEQFELLELGYGLTNAAYRTTPGSGDLRRSDFDRQSFERRIGSVAPRVVAFVGKEAYRGLWNERPELGPQLRPIGSTGLFVVPSTSPANAAVPYAERLRWFRELRAWLEPEEREAVRAVCIDAHGRVLLTRFGHPVTLEAWWATVGGGIDAGESDEEALRRELREEAGLVDFEIGPLVHTRVHTFPWDRRLLRQRERFYVVRIDAHEPAPTIDVAAEGVTDVRWWTPAELADPPEAVVPAELGELVRRLAA
jgi:G:T/U-mismatch repair DNA glycosylase/ADP-ribose pyrophosphatase YjhB (NUDIX family)